VARVSLTPCSSAGFLSLIMSESSLRYCEGPFQRKELERWSHTIRNEYPDHQRMTDRAPALIVGPLTMLSSRNLIVCRDGDNLVGLLRYTEPDDTGCERIEIIQLAVLPSHQKRGIGSTLIEMLKEKGRRRVPIFASWGVLPPAIAPLTRAGFWPIKVRRDGVIYKWSDLPEHKNDRLAVEDADAENQTTA
jgi:GNAT superfamily N-acetyltransferase